MLLWLRVNKHGNLPSIYVLTGRNEDHEKKISQSCYVRLSGDRHHETVGTGACCVWAGSLRPAAAIHMIDSNGLVSGEEKWIGGLIRHIMYRLASIGDQDNSTRELLLTYH